MIGMRATTDADAEAWVLSSDQGLALLAEVSVVAAPLPADLTRWRKLASPDQVAGAVRLAEARRRGAAKFTRADRMWFEPTGLEQATAEPVARHKAARFAGRAATVVDLCCGIGGDTLALAESVSTSGGSGLFQDVQMVCPEFHVKQALCIRIALGNPGVGLAESCG